MTSNLPKQPYREAVIDRAERALIRANVLGGSPLGVMAVYEMLDLARTAAPRRDHLASLYDPFDLAKRYCDAAEAALKQYTIDLRRWENTPRTERKAEGWTKPRRPTPSALAETLAPARKSPLARSTAIARLNAARHPLLLEYLGLKDPLA